MICCVCKEKPATVHLTDIKGDKVQKVDLCEDCAKNKGVNDSAFQLADMLLGLGAAHEMEQSAGGPDVKCDACGFTQADFKKSGRLGCPECYVTFADGLEGLLKSMHKGTKHTGKIPESLRSRKDFAEQLAKLNKKLAQAIATEDFEQAAELRDEIKQLNSNQTAKTVIV